MEKLDFLIEYLLEENNEINIKNIPTYTEEKRKLYRSLCNIRQAKSILDEYIKVENEYLQEELKNKNITNINDIETIDKQFKESNLKMKDKICLWQGDITILKIEAIVNAANSQGLGCFIPCHKCIDNQINTFAGVNLRLECNSIMKNKNYNLETGKAIITNAYNLPSEKVIHTVGPIIYENVTEQKEQELKECYINSLKLAIENNIKTIAFPCISTGEFRFPKKKACQIAITSVNEFLEENADKFDKVVFNVFSREDFEIYEQFIRENK